MSKTFNSGIRTTIGRFQPPHLGHKLAFQDTFRSGLVFVGDVEENRNMAKNPFSYKQRIEMLKMLTPDSNVIFVPYRQTPEGKSNPPSLDGMIRQMKERCKEHKIPFESLEIVIPFKLGDGHDVVIEGKLYEKTHHFLAAAKHYNLRYSVEKLQSHEGQVINASDIRRNLANTFHLLSPEVFNYMQAQMILAHINSRQVGADPVGDKLLPKEAKLALAKLVQSGKMMGFDQKKPGMSDVVEVPEQRRSLFLEYLSRTPSTSPLLTAEPEQSQPSQHGRT